MRIDLNRLLASQVATEKASKSVANSGKEESSAATQDKTSLSLGSAGLSALAATVAQTPEIRQDKVEALRQAIRSGTYKVQPDKIADAMLREVSEK